MKLGSILAVKERSLKMFIRTLKWTMLLAVLIGSSAANDSGVSVDTLGQASKNANGDYWVTFGDKYIIQLMVDRDYKILGVRMKGWSGILAYTLAPSDGDSSASIVVDKIPFMRSDEEIAKSPGFTHIVKSKLRVGPEDVDLREWSDSKHTYGEVSFDAKLLGGSEQTIKVTIYMVANSPQRLHSLEGCLSSLIVEERK